MGSKAPTDRPGFIQTGHILITIRGLDKSLPGHDAVVSTCSSVIWSKTEGALINYLNYLGCL